MKALFFFSILIMFTSCAHHRDVRPSANGIHKVVVVSEEESGGQRDALSQANHFCEKKYEKSAAIVQERTKYSGDMDESNYKLGRTASKVLKTGGSSAWVFGGKKESEAGKVATGSGSVLDSALGNGYTTQMTFKCI